MSSMRHSLERMEVSPVEERFIQMSAEGRLDIRRDRHQTIATCQGCGGAPTSQCQTPPSYCPSWWDWPSPAPSSCPPWRPRQPKSSPRNCRDTPVLSLEFCTAWQVWWSQYLATSPLQWSCTGQPAGPWESSSTSSSSTLRSGELSESLRYQWN